MPKYRHTGEWTNHFALPGHDELVPLEPGEEIELDDPIEHSFLQIVGAGPQRKAPARKRAPAKPRKPKASAKAEAQPAAPSPEASES